MSIDVQSRPILSFNPDDQVSLHFSELHFRSNGYLPAVFLAKLQYMRWCFCKSGVTNNLILVHQVGGFLESSLQLWSIGVNVNSWDEVHEWNVQLHLHECIMVETPRTSHSFGAQRSRQGGHEQGLAPSKFLSTAPDDVNLPSGSFAWRWRAGTSFIEERLACLRCAARLAAVKPSNFDKVQIWFVDNQVSFPFSRNEPYQLLTFLSVLLSSRYAVVLNPATLCSMFWLSNQLFEDFFTFSSDPSASVLS